MDGTLNQPYLLAAAIYAGMLAGVVYSLFQLVRKAFHGGKLFLVAADILFLAVVFILAAIMLYTACHMKIRPYHYVGMGIGFGMYECAIFPIGRKIFKLFKKNKEIGGQGVDKREKKSSNKR